MLAFPPDIDGHIDDFYARGCLRRGIFGIGCNETEIEGAIGTLCVCETEECNTGSTDLLD